MDDTIICKSILLQIIRNFCLIHFFKFSCFPVEDFHWYVAGFGGGDAFGRLFIHINMLLRDSQFFQGDHLAVFVLVTAADADISIDVQSNFCLLSAPCYSCRRRKKAALVRCYSDKRGLLMPVIIRLYFLHEQYRNRNTIPANDCWHLTIEDRAGLSSAIGYASG